MRTVDIMARIPSVAALALLCLPGTAAAGGITTPGGRGRAHPGPIRVVLPVMPINRGGLRNPPGSGFRIPGAPSIGIDVRSGPQVQGFAPSGWTPAGPEAGRADPAEAPGQTPGDPGSRRRTHEVPLPGLPPAVVEGLVEERGRPARAEDSQRPWLSAKIEELKAPLERSAKLSRLGDDSALDLGRGISDIVADSQAGARRGEADGLADSGSPSVVGVGEEGARFFTEQTAPESPLGMVPAPPPAEVTEEPRLLNPKDGVPLVVMKVAGQALFLSHAQPPAEAAALAAEALVEGPSRGGPVPTAGGEVSGPLEAARASGRPAGRMRSTLPLLAAAALMLSPALLSFMKLHPFFAIGLAHASTLGAVYAFTRRPDGPSRGWDKAAPWIAAGVAAATQAVVVATVPVKPLAYVVLALLPAMGLLACFFIETTSFESVWNRFARAFASYGLVVTVLMALASLPAAAFLALQKALF